MIDAPELKPPSLGVVMNVGQGKQVGMDLGLLGIDTRTPDGNVGLKFLLPPGVDEALVAEVAKQRGITSLASSSLTIGAPNVTGGFRAATAAFTLVLIDGRSILVQGRFQGAFGDPAQGDQALSGLFLVLNEGMKQKASRCPVERVASQ